MTNSPYGLKLEKILAKYGLYLSKNTGIILAKKAIKKKNTGALTLVKPRPNFFVLVASLFKKG